jgi:hypothetical protein
MAEIDPRNLSTEHQRPGDAERPQDVLDRAQPKPAREDSADPSWGASSSGVRRENRCSEQINLDRHGDQADKATR